MRAGSSRAAPRTATASRRRPSSAWRHAARACSSLWTAASPRSTRSPSRAPRAWTSSSPTITRPARTACCPTRRSCIPGVAGYPCPELCGAGVAHMLARALRDDDAERPDDLELVALATVADCVPLRGENRRLVRAGLRAMGTTRCEGLRALMRVAQGRPRAHRRAGHRLPPRTAVERRGPAVSRGRRGRAAAHGRRRPRTAIAEELDRVNAERRHVEQRILFEAEGMVAEAGDRAARTCSPARDGTRASSGSSPRGSPSATTARACSSRSTASRGRARAARSPAFDLLGGLDACAAHLVRHGGHRAAAGCQVRRDDVAGFRATFEAHAAAVLRPAGPRPRAARRRGRRRRRARPRPGRGARRARAVRHRATPMSRCSSPPRACPIRGRWGRAATCGSPSARAAAVRRPWPSAATDVDTDGPLDAVVALEVNEWGGAVSPRLVLRHGLRCAPPPIEVVGEPEDFLGAALAVLDAPLPTPEIGPRWPGGPLGPLPVAPGPGVRDRRGGGIAGIVSSLVHTGEPVLVVVADAAARARQLAAIVGGSAAVLARRPARRSGARGGRARRRHRPARRRPRRPSTCWRAELAGRSIWPGDPTN